MLVLTEQDNHTEQYGHQSSGGEAIWEGQDLRVTGLHVSSTVTGTHTDYQRAGTALDGVVVVGDHDGEKVHAHLTPAEPPSPGQDVGSVIYRKMEVEQVCQPYG